MAYKFEVHIWSISNKIRLLQTKKLFGIFLMEKVLNSRNLAYLEDMHNWYFSSNIDMFDAFFIPSPTKLWRDIVTLPSFRPSHPCEHSRINILQWILTKLGTLRESGTLLIFKVIGQRSRSPDQIFTA
jgi:hypothetical protein